MSDSSWSGPISWLVGAIVGLLAGCGTGGVEIVFLFPDSEELAPVTQEVAEIILVRTAPGEPVSRTVHEIDEPGGSAELGRVDVGNEVRLSVELRSTTQRLLGYGRSAAVDIQPGASVEVPIQVRRPFVYVTGDTSLASYDATRDTSSGAYRGAIDVGSQPLAAAPTADGTELLVVGSGGAGVTLSRVSTSDHGMTSADLAILARSVVDLAVSEDGRYAVAAHPGVDGGVSVVDLGAAAGPTVTLVTLGDVGRVVVAGDRAVALVEAGLIDGALDCTPRATQVVALPLADPTATGPSLPFANPIADIAATSTGSLVLAAGCDNGGELRAVDPDDPGSLRTLAGLPGASAVAVFEERAWGVGTVPDSTGTGVRLELVSVGLDAADETRIELAQVQERTRNVGLSDPGDEANRQLDPDAMTAYHLTVLPGTDYVGILTRGYFFAEAQGQVLDNPILPQTELDNREYMLVDTATGTVIQRVRWRCDLAVGNAWVGDWECSLSAGQHETGSTVTPVGLTALYGAR